MSEQEFYGYQIETIRSFLSDSPFESVRNFGKYDGEPESHIVIAIADAFREANFCSGAKGSGTFMSFDGSVYVRITKDEIKAIIAEIFRMKGLTGRYLTITPDKAFSYIANRINLQILKPTRSMVSFRNGVMEMDNGFAFHDISPKYQTAVYIDTDYDPKAKCPMFDKFLSEVLPKEDDRLLVQEIFGYMFVNRRRVKLETIALFLGEGRNGKSVLSDIVCGVVGDDNISSFSLYDLVDHQNADYKLAECNGKLLNYCPDMDKKDVSGGRYKSIISGDPVEARHPHERAFKATNIPPMVANVNEIPISSDQTFGHHRRQLIVKFGVIIPDEKVNTSLADDILSEEKSGVLNWILGGTARVLANSKFSISESAKEATDEAKVNSSSTLQFLREKNYTSKEVGSIDFKILSAFYEEYKSYCIDCGNKSLNRMNFRKQMEREGFKYRRRTAGMGFDFFIKPDIDVDGTIVIDVDKVEPEQLPF